MSLHPAMRFVSLCLLIALAHDAPLFAQGGDKQSRKPTGRLVWFVTTGIPQDLENPVDVLTGKDITQITLSKRSPSEPVKIPEDGIIRLVRRTPNPDDPSKPLLLTLAQARIPAAMSKALVILIPQPKEGSPQVFRAQVQNLAGFKGGDTLYLNLTTVNIAVQLGDKKIGIKPGDTTIHSVPALAKPTNMPVSYQYFHPSQKKWRLLSASTVVLRPTRREICIFSWDPRYNRVDYHGITFPVTP